MPIPAYRAKQSTDTSGTGTLVLNAAETNARSFNTAFGASARRIMYCISWATGFEIGYGDFDGGTPGSLTRATVLASSNAGALVTLPAGTKDVFAVFEPAAREVVAISGTATLALADLGNAVVFTGSSAATLNLPAVATVPNGAGWLVMNRGTAALTIDPNGAEQVNGAATLVLQAGQAAMILRVSGAWQAALSGGTAIGAALQAALNSAAAADVLSAAPVDIASAATTDIGAATSPNVRVTGTTPITSLGTAPAGTRRFLTFAAVLTITYNATSLQTPGLANIITAAGDTAVARSLGSGNWVIESFTRAAILPFLNSMATARVLGRVTAGSGAIEDIPLGNAAAALSLAINRGTEQATTSGTAIDFTSIPAGVRRITIAFNGVSSNGTSNRIVQIGSGSFVTSGYVSSGGSIAAGAAGGTSITSAFLAGNTTLAADAVNGVMTLINISGNNWVASFAGGSSGGNLGMVSGGFLSLGGVLDRVRITNANGTDTFDAGAVNIMWEF